MALDVAKKAHELYSEIRALSDRRKYLISLLDHPEKVIELVYSASQEYDKYSKRALYIELLYACYKSEKEDLFISYFLYFDRYSFDYSYLNCIAEHLSGDRRKRFIKSVYAFIPKEVISEYEVFQII